MSWAIPQGGRDPKGNGVGPWMGCYRDATGKQRSKSGFRLKKEAEQWGAAQEAAIRSGTWIDPAGPKMKVKDWITVWQSSRRTDGHGAAGDASIIAQQILPKWGDRAIGSIKLIEVKGWVNDLSGTATQHGRPYAPLTVRKYYGLFRRIMEAAVEDEVIGRNPCRLKADDLPRVESEQKTMLTADECAALIAAAPERERAMIHTALYTGMRWGELAALRWSDVDLVDGVIHVRQNLESIGGSRRFKAPKTAGSKRRIDLHASTVKILTDHLEMQQQEVATRRKPIAGDLVFTSPKGLTLRHGNYYNTVWLPTLRASGIGKVLTFHSLRAVHLSLLLHAGVDVLTVSRRAGHAHASMTLDVYGRTNPTGGQSVRDAIDKMGRE